MDIEGNCIQKQQSFNNALRDSYYKHYREYKNLHRKKYTKLDDLKSNDPKAYCNLVKSLKNEQENHKGYCFDGIIMSET